MRTIHLVYSVPRGNLFERFLDRLSRAGLLPYRYRDAGKGIRWPRPLRHPHSMSYHLLKELTKHYRVKHYSMYEHGVCDTKEGDIVIAQPAPVLPHVPPREIDREAVTYRTFTEREGITKVIIMPYSHDETYTRWWSELVRDHGKNCIFVSGEPWMKTWDTLSPFRTFPIQHKLRLDIGVDPEDFPHIKKTFNPEGKRGVLYIGHTGWYKNVQMLEAIAEALPDVRFGHVGGGDVKGFTKISDFAALTPAFMETLAKDYDIFITVSSGDPNATTVVEMLSSGFIVACTPQTGYEGPAYVKLSVDDLSHNVAMLRELQSLPSEEIKRRSAENSRYAREHFDWDRITADVVGFIGRIS